MLWNISVVKGQYSNYSVNYKLLSHWSQEYFFCMICLFITGDRNENQKCFVCSLFAVSSYPSLFVLYYHCAVRYSPTCTSHQLPTISLLPEQDVHVIFIWIWVEVVKLTWLGANAQTGLLVSTCGNIHECISAPYIFVQGITITYY